MEEKVKILVAYHKDALLIQNDVLTPIHVGRALKTSEWLEQNMMGDNIGDNISHKNNRYCELTAQYFAWKNPDLIDEPDYIGIFHYRRMLNFNTAIEYPTNFDEQVECHYWRDDHKFLEDYGLNEEQISKIVKNYDVVTLKPMNLELKDSKTVYKQYKASHNIKDYKIAIKILLKKYPEFSSAAKIYNNSAYGYYANCFVMKKKIFNDYSKWLFSILFETENHIKNRTKDSYDRVLGHIAERLLGIYITHLKLQNKKIKNLQPIFLEHSKKTIPVVFSCNNNYAQHLCCAITSILKNANPDEYFNFYIINSKKNLNYLHKKMINRLKNNQCQIIFVTIDNFEAKLKNLPMTSDCTHITIETYYRFLLAGLFKFYDKILYLDCDLNVLSSLAELYETNIDEYYWAGVEDLLIKASAKRLDLVKYCNAGVMLINLKKWREDNIEKKLFDYAINNIDKIIWQDQDVLNTVLQDKIMYVDKKWNALVGEYEHCYLTGFNEIGKTANIIHHIGSKKPWKIDCKSPFKNIYFDYLKQTNWECKYLSHWIHTIKYIIEFSLKEMKIFRQSIIWYDSRNKQIVLFKKFFYKHITKSYD